MQIEFIQEIVFRGSWSLGGSFSDIMRCLAGFIYTINVFMILSVVQCEEDNYFEDKLDPTQIVDPHSFYYDKHSKKIIMESDVEVVENMIQDTGKDTEQENKCVQQMDNYSSHEGVFYKRLINMLLSNMNIKIEDEVSIVGLLEIEVSHSQMKILQNINTQKTSLREIDEILSNIIRKPQNQYMDNVMYGFDVLFTNLGRAFKVVQDNPDLAIIVLGVFMIFLMFRMIKWGRGFPMFIFIQVIFLMSFFMTWWQLLQDAEVKSAAAQMKFKDIPISCQPDKMSLWDKFVAFVTSSEDCEKYYQAILSNPKLKITPAHVLSHFLTTIILHPITQVGTAVSGFIQNATDGLPWTYAWIVKCMLFLCVGFVIIILPLCLSGASLNLGLGPLLRFGIDYRKKDNGDRNTRKGNSLENIQKRDPVQIILQIPTVTNVPMLEQASNIEKSKVVQILKSDIKTEEKESVDAESDNHEFCQDFGSCGDSVTNTQLIRSDYEKVRKHEQPDEVKVKKNDGSGDS